MRTRVTLAVAASLVVLAAMSMAATASAGLPVIYNYPIGVAAYLAGPDASPPGANDWSCRPSAAHPRPVVLVHGTFFTASLNWNALSPLLKNNGYCVFAANYGRTNPDLAINGLKPVADSAAELSTFVDGVLQATGASQVDMVGHSQGGMLPRYYMKFDGGAAKVHTLVGLAPANHGTTLDGIGTLASALPLASTIAGLACPVCADLAAGSDATKGLNAGGETLPGVSYTVIETIYDLAVTPYTSAFLSGPGVTNIVLQRQCILDATDHVAIVYDHIALRDVLNALDPAHARRPVCTPIVPLVGG
jgi:triacylglycerol esterase/lipase EstA (alpha/beta hydrolase family)